MNTQINWDMPGIQIEQKSFKCIEQEYTGKKFNTKEWPVVRRVIHSTADLSIGELFRFAHNPIDTVLQALKDGCSIYSDSNMIKSGISKAKISKINPIYKTKDITCLVADKRVAKIAKEKNIARSLAALDVAKDDIDDGIILIGNAPLALAGIVKMSSEGLLKPRIIIGMPVGFVHVIESKQMLYESDIAYVSIDGRRGGSPLAVAAFHGMLEETLKQL